LEGNYSANPSLFLWVQNLKLIWELLFRSSAKTMKQEH